MPEGEAFCVPTWPVGDFREVPADDREYPGGRRVLVTCWLALGGGIFSSSLGNGSRFSEAPPWDLGWEDELTEVLGGEVTAVVVGCGWTAAVDAVAVVVDTDAGGVGFCTGVSRLVLADVAGTSVFP